MRGRFVCEKGKPYLVSINSHSVIVVCQIYQHIIKRLPSVVKLWITIEYIWNGFLGNVAVAANYSGCGNHSSADPACLKCGAAGCLKCPNFIEMDTRKCVSDCRRGYVGQWSTAADFMGRICRPTNGVNMLFVSIVGLAFAAILCGGLAAIVMYIMKRRRRKKTFRDQLIDENLARVEFLRQLDELRPNAEYFLVMLNDTRRQIRKLHFSGDSLGAQAYRPVVRDLAKILLLINRPIELLPAAPSDWYRLFEWSQRVLDRYKPQIGPLIDFLQSSQTALTDSRLASCQHHTFKSITTNSTTTSDSPNLQMQTFGGSLISLQDFEERTAVTLPRLSDPFGSLKSAIKRHSTSDVHGSAMWLEDEFFKLGMRPQDEITTEL